MNQYNKEQLRYSSYDPTQDPILAGMGVTDETEVDNTNEEQGGNFDAEAWGNGIGSVLDGVGGLLAGLGVGNNNNNLPTNTNNPSGNNNQPRVEEKKPNYMLWLIILVVIILLIIGFVMLRKGKANPTT